MTRDEVIAAVQGATVEFPGRQLILHKAFSVPLGVNVKLTFGELLDVSLQVAFDDNEHSYVESNSEERAIRVHFSLAPNNLISTHIVKDSKATELFVFHTEPTLAIQVTLLVLNWRSCYWTVTVWEMPE